MGCRTKHLSAGPVCERFEWTVTDRAFIAPKPRLRDLLLQPDAGLLQDRGRGDLSGRHAGRADHFVSRENVNDLRHHLTLWLVIAIVAIINIVSFLLFTFFWMIYRWIKQDLDPVDDE